MPVFLAPLLGFLGNPIVAVAIALAAAWAWHSYDKAAAIRAHDAAALEQRRAAVAEFVVGLSARNTQLAADLTRARGQIRTETVEILREVPRYVTPAADRACVVPRGFVWHHDAAWGLSALPREPGGSVDAPSGIPLSRVESRIAENASTCRDLRAEADAWRRWYAENAKRFDDFARTTGR